MKAVGFSELFDGRTLKHEVSSAAAGAAEAGRVAKLFA